MYTIRRATLNDIDSLVELRLELQVEANDRDLGNDKDKLRENLIHYFRENFDTKFFSWVAESDDEIVAISGLNIFEKPPALSNLSGLEGYIMNMYVKKDYRKYGIATSLMKTIISYLKDRDITEVTLKATEMGKPIYKKLGFEEYPNGMKLHIDCKELS